MKIVIASSNPGKIREFESLLVSKNMQIVPQTQLGIKDVAETGLSFVENALLKARHACQHSGLPAIADDSGLVVPALQGAPGIYSARYAGENAKSPDNIKKLLKEMTALSGADRQAAFHCVLVYMRHEKDPIPLICQGSWEGEILLQAQGQDGFGYDPVFGVGENQSAAELPLEIKNQRSHRGKALRALVEQLL